MHKFENTVLTEIEYLNYYSQHQSHAWLQNYICSIAWSEWKLHFIHANKNHKQYKATEILL